jgi:CheY-like chemotaxis protein
VRILIVNGLSESRLRLRNILSGAGYEVLEADSGEIVLLGHVPPILMEAEPLASIVDGFLNIDVATDELLATVRKLVGQRI